MDVEVPDGHTRGHVALAGTPPNAEETRIGPPREEDVRVSERYPRDVAVREREDGTRYVGVKQQYADAVMAWFAETYGVTYDDSGAIVRDTPDDTATTGDTTDADPSPDVDADTNDTDDTTDTDTDTDAETDGTDTDASADTDQGPTTDDRPTAPENTQDAHWNAVVSAIEAGAYDDALGTVEDNDSRQSVHEAVADRQEVLN
jgi:hypothetical protein